MSNGITIERETNCFVAADEKIRPLKDRIVVKPLDWNASKIVLAIREGRPIRGEVMAVGPGAYQKATNKEKTKIWETDTFVPMTVKVGDIVQWGGLNIFDGKGYSFEELTWGNEKCLWITEKDVCGIEE